MWKRDLDLYWPADAPAWSMSFEEDRAEVRSAHDSELVASAERHGERLSLWDKGDVDSVEAVATLSLALAVRGWPLVRSAEAWERERFSDLGGPESLAYKITIWEAWSRARGWRVDTPRIPGLAYPSWEELERAWKR
jgi:hypothetical protein